MRAGVLTNFDELFIHDVTRVGAQAAIKKASGVAVGDEADVVTVRLCRDGESPDLSFRPYRGLQRTSEWKAGALKLILGEDTEDVGLVLGVVDRTVEFDATLATDKIRVMARADRLETQRNGSVEDGRKLDFLVAGDARVRGAAGGVLGDEVVYHVGLKSIGQVPDVERDADRVGRTSGVVCVLLGATAAGAGTEGLGVLGQRQMNAGHLVPGLDSTCRGDSGINAARHRGQNPHAVPFRFLTLANAATLYSGASGGRARLLPQAMAPARRALEIATGSAAARASMSAAVDVCPRENLSDDRASASPPPMASRTWLGCATPAEQAEPVEQSMSAASRSRSRASAEQPGKLTFTIPGSASAGFAGPWSMASGTAASTSMINSARSSRRRRSSA